MIGAAAGVAGKAGVTLSVTAFIATALVYRMAGKPGTGGDHTLWKSNVMGWLVLQQREQHQYQAAGLAASLANSDSSLAQQVMQAKTANGSSSRGSSEMSAALVTVAAAATVAANAIAMHGQKIGCCCCSTMAHSFALPLHVLTSSLLCHAGAAAAAAVA